MAPSFAQSAPLCYSLASVGGILEVGATAVLAVPDARKKEGKIMSHWKLQAALAGNVMMQLVGSLASNLFAPWFGPVSIVAPIYFSSTLIANILIFGILLGLECFTKNMRVGTYVIAVATVMLPIVGPGVQQEQQFDELVHHLHTGLWLGLLLTGMMITTAFLTLGITQYKEKIRIAILLVARSTSFTLNLTVSRAFILAPGHSFLLACIIIKVVSGAIYTYAIVVQSTTVEQNTFVPLNATIIILVNALTGVIVWEDWMVVESWLGYLCVFILLALGCDLLLSTPILNADNQEYGRIATEKLLRSQKRRQEFSSVDFTEDATFNDNDSDNDSEHGGGSVTTDLQSHFNAEPATPNIKMTNYGSLTPDEPSPPELEGILQ
mmetsp:Transcript_13754/g.19220  ORF Transcript_13754/g.19220 Transcript_13754/m.19220 type:complete len:380 (+) Transcript_13754:198-1337(+)